MQGAAWETKDEFEAQKSSPVCTTTPPKGINPEFYRWPKSETDAYHGYAAERYYKKKMFYCHGDAPETEKVIYVWPTWHYHPREEWSYPLTFVDTAGGVLAVRGRERAHTLLLNGEPLLNGLIRGTIDQAFSEESGKPQIVIVTLEPNTNIPHPPPAGRRIIDLGVSPPFVSREELPIGWYETVLASFADTFSPPESRIKIKKIDEDTYEFSGQWWGTDKNHERPHAVFRYNRKTRTVTKM